MSFFEDILKKLGWDDGFQMPVANVENQELEKELAKLTLHKVKTKAALDNSVGRLNNLREHLKFVTQENEQTQKLITAHKQQYDGEGNQFYSLRGEKNKLEYDIAEVKKRIHFLEENKRIQRNTLEKAVIKIDRIKQETGWDIEALKAWEEALKKRDDDNEMIKKFCKEDERKFNELEARRQFLQSEYDTKNITIGKMMCDLHSCEMIIERTGKAIKQQMNEREALVRQWKDAVRMLQQRDSDIDAGQERIFETQKHLEKLQECLEEQSIMWNNEKKNNHNVLTETEKLNAANSRMRRDLSELQQSTSLLFNECHAAKRRVLSAANILEKTRMKIRILDTETVEKEHKFIKDQEDLKILERKIADMKGSSMNSAERVTKIQKLILTEEKRSAILIADTDIINSQIYRTEQLLKEQQEIGKNLEIQINNTYCISNKLRKHILDEKKALDKIKEVVYDMQFRIDEFEQRLCKLEGSSKGDEHVDEKDEKIKELEKTLALHAEVQHTLQGQVDRLQDEMRKLTNFIAADKEHLEILKNKVEHHLLVYDIGRKQISTAKKSTQEKQVEENIMRLRINHIETDMQKEDQKIFNLQKLRLTLDQFMKERNLEIDSNKQVVLAKRRNLEDEKGRIKSDIILRKVKLDHLQKKFHIELMSLGKDEDGQAISVTHFKIKNAQEKFMLQQQGDELDQKIKVAEKEIVAIENTLKVVNLTNVAFRNNLTTLNNDDIEVQELKELEKLFNEWTQKIRHARHELHSKETEINELNKVLNEELKAQKQEKKYTVDELEEENVFIEKQEKSKEEKLQRTETQLRKLAKKLNPQDYMIYEDDLEIRQLKDGNSIVVKKLNTLTTEYADMGPNIHVYAEKYQINMNLQESLSSSSNAFSTDSSTSSDNLSGRSLTMRMGPVAVKKVDISFM